MRTVSRYVTRAPRWIHTCTRAILSCSFRAAFRWSKRMLSYVYFGTNNLQNAVAFYDAALGALGMQRCTTGDPQWDLIAAGWGIYEDSGMRELAFWVGKPFDQQPATTGNGSMVAFRARSWQEVDD